LFCIRLAPHLAGPSCRLAVCLLPPPPPSKTHSLCQPASLERPAKLANSAQTRIAAKINCCRSSEQKQLIAVVVVVVVSASSGEGPLNLNHVNSLPSLPMRLPLTVGGLIFHVQAHSGPICWRRKFSLHLTQISIVFVSAASMGMPNTVYWLAVEPFIGPGRALALRSHCAPAIQRDEVEPADSTRLAGDKLGETRAR